MSFATLESEILHEARAILCNRKLRLKDLLEWSTGTPKVEEGEVSIRLTRNASVTVVVAKENDKRKPACA